MKTAQNHFNKGFLQRNFTVLTNTKGLCVCHCADLQAHHARRHVQPGCELAACHHERHGGSCRAEGMCV